MKTSFIKILFFAFCLATISCGSNENLDAYKDKILEELAKKFKTTKELLVKDLDVIVDSMSVVPLTIEDSLNLLSSDYEKEKNRLSKQIEKNKTGLASAKKRLFPITSVIWDYEEKIEAGEKEMKEVTENYNAKQELYSQQDKSKVLAKVFICRIALKHPLKGIHQTISGATVFSIDGQTLLDEGDNHLYEYFKAKTTEQAVKEKM